jgi:hypothetical protein
MDAASMAHEIADHLRGRDDIAETKVGAVEEGVFADMNFATIMVRTQGGAFYEVRVLGEKITKQREEETDGS